MTVFNKEVVGEYVGAVGCKVDGLKVMGCFEGFSVGLYVGAEGCRVVGLKVGTCVGFNEGDRVGGQDVLILNF